MTDPMISSRLVVGGSNYFPDDWVPTKDAVIIGRGKLVQEHDGNKKLRDLVQGEVYAYANATNRAAKSAIIMRIYKAIRPDDSSSAVGFVKKDPKTKRYFVVEDTAAKGTIAQYLRDALCDHKILDVGHYKSSKQYKQKLRAQERLRGLTNLKRSVSDIGGRQRRNSSSCEPSMLGYGSLTSMRRSASLGDPSRAMMMPYAAAMIKASSTIAHNNAAVDCGEEEPPSYFMKMAHVQTPNRNLTTTDDDKITTNGSLFHGFPQSASDLLADWDDDDREMISWADTTTASSNATSSNNMIVEADMTNVGIAPLRTDERAADDLSSKKTFTHLYEAFGSNVDINCNPYEPTPLKEITTKRRPTTKDILEFEHHHHHHHRKAPRDGGFLKPF